MSLVKWEKDETVAVLTMTNGENRHNPDYTAEMLKAYDEIMADEEIKALVLTSNDPKNFSLGVDLGWMMQMQQKKDIQGISDWLIKHNEVFRFLLMAPMPTIAAITGHAFGNGALMSLACDFRFMRSDRGYMCLPEVDLGIMFTPSMLEWVKRSMPYHLVQKMIYTGMKVSAAELEKYNVIVKACADTESTLKEAIAFAKTFNKKRNTVKEMKVRMYKHITDKIDNEDNKYLVPPVDMFRV
jgi:enoyl-CoA hydratase/carnithine racemase